MKLDTLIRFGGNTEEAFNFYRSLFGGEFGAVMRWKEMPDEAFVEKLSEGDKEAIMHISLPIGDGNTLMGCDVLKSLGHKYTPGDNFSMSITTDSNREADDVFGSLAEHGQIIKPMEDAFWGSYFGMVTDRFGIQWMISCENESE